MSDDGARPIGSIARRERAARGRRAALPVTRLNLAAMIDVVFLLMIYFMLISEFRAPEAAFELDLPQRIGAATPVDPFALPMRPIVIEVRSFGDGAEDYALGTDDPDLTGAATYERLTTRARAMREGGDMPGAQRFVIRPMAGGRWEHALGAFNALRRAGFTEVRFATPGA